MPTLLAAALSLAAPVPLPRYNPGDAFVFSDGRVERVVADEGDHVVWRGLRGPSYRRNRNFVVPVLRWRSGRGLGARKVRGDPDRLWPIEKPRSVRFRVVTETRKHPRAARKRSVAMWVCKSSKPRSFAVPAGTFTAIPFLCDRYSTTTMRLIERREWDYAPALGHYIRRVRHHYLRGTFSSIELVSALSGPAATEARLKALSRKARADRLAER